MTETNKVLDNKILLNWFKYEWANKCKSRMYNEHCDARIQTCRAEYKIWIIIE